MKAADFIKDFVEKNQDKYELYEGYSGKGMFGRKCLGVIIRNGNSHIDFLMDLTSYMTEQNFDDKNLEFEGTSVDDLGKDIIVYFPEIGG